MPTRNAIWARGGDLSAAGSAMTQPRYRASASEDQMNIVESREFQVTWSAAPAGAPSPLATQECASVILIHGANLPPADRQHTAKDRHLTAATPPGNGPSRRLLRPRAAWSRNCRNRRCKHSRAH